MVTSAAKLAVEAERYARGECVECGAPVEAADRKDGAELCAGCEAWAAAIVIPLRRREAIESAAEVRSWAYADTSTRDALGW